MWNLIDWNWLLFNVKYSRQRYMKSSTVMYWIKMKTDWSETRRKRWRRCSRQVVWPLRCRPSYASLTPHYPLNAVSLDNLLTKKKTIEWINQIRHTDKSFKETENTKARKLIILKKFGVKCNHINEQLKQLKININKRMKTYEFKKQHFKICLQY